METSHVVIARPARTVAAVASRVGLRHAETLHRAFARRVGTTPDRYRQHFARRSA